MMHRHHDPRRPLADMVFQLSRWYDMSYRMWAGKRWAIFVTRSVKREVPLSAEEAVRVIYHPLRPIGTEHDCSDCLHWDGHRSTRDITEQPVPCQWCHIATQGMRLATGDPTAEATCIKHAEQDNTDCPVPS